MSELIVIDLEGTCKDDGCGGPMPHGERETIEIGAVIVDAQSGKELSFFSEFVRPVRHPVLSNFCTELTGITQLDVDDARPFREVWVTQFLPWLSGRDEFCSWGMYDLDQFWRDCSFHQLPIHFRRHCNLSQAYSNSRCGKGKAMRRLGITPTGRNHRGLDDARNIASIAVAMIKVGKEIPFLMVNGK